MTPHQFDESFCFQLDRTRDLFVETPPPIMLYFLERAPERISGVMGFRSDDIEHIVASWEVVDPPKQHRAMMPLLRRIPK